MAFARKPRSLHASCTQIHTRKKHNPRRRSSFIVLRRHFPIIHIAINWACNYFFGNFSANVRRCSPRRRCFSRLFTILYSTTFTHVLGVRTHKHTYTRHQYDARRDAQFCWFRVFVMLLLMLRFAQISNEQNVCVPESHWCYRSWPTERNSRTSLTYALHRHTIPVSQLYIHVEQNIRCEIKKSDCSQKRNRSVVTGRVTSHRRETTPNNLSLDSRLLVQLLLYVSIAFCSRFDIQPIASLQLKISHKIVSFFCGHVHNNVWNVCIVASSCSRHCRHHSVHVLVCACTLI